MAKLKVETKVNIDEEELKIMITNYFVKELGFVEVEETSRWQHTRVASEIRRLVIKKVESFLRENKEEIVNKIVENVSEKFDLKKNKKLIIETLLKD